MTAYSPRSAELADDVIDRRAATLLAAGLLLVELVAACQSYLTTTITPLMAQELSAQGSYGLLAAATQAALFLTMPLGAALLSRWSAAQMMTWLTPLIVLGAVLSAVAPTLALFLTGRVLAALAAGALMTVSLSALATALPAAWRRIVLAGYALVWLIASLLGPMYAGWTAAAVGWRWSLVGYLPLFLLARWVVIVQLRRHDRGQAGPSKALGLGPAVVLASGITLVSLAGDSWARIALALLGAVAVVFAAVRILPAGTLWPARGRHGAILLMGVLTFSYFGAQSIVAITAHDLLGRDAGPLAVLLAAGGVGWAVLGILCGRWPARSTTAYGWRIVAGALLLAAGGGMMAFAVVPGMEAAWPLLLTGWSVAGLGMGLCYVDTLNRILDEPLVPDGLGPHSAAQAVVMVEVIATAGAATLTATVLAWVLAAPADRAVVAAFTYGALGLLALVMIPLARRT